MSIVTQISSPGSAVGVSRGSGTGWVRASIGRCCSLQRPPHTLYSYQINKLAVGVGLHCKTAMRASSLTAARGTGLLLQARKLRPLGKSSWIHPLAKMAMQLFDQVPNSRRGVNASEAAKKWIQKLVVFRLYYLVVFLCALHVVEHKCSETGWFVWDLFPR